HRAMEHSPRIVRLCPVMRQDSVEQDDVSRDLQQLASPRVVRALCRGDQQAEDQRGHCCDQRDPQLHDILCIRAEMLLRQHAARKQADQRASEHARENHGTDRYGTQSLSPTGNTILHSPRHLSLPLFSGTCELRVTPLAWWPSSMTVRIRFYSAAC